MSQDIYADNVSRIKEKLSGLQNERTSNYDALANAQAQAFSGPTGTLAEYSDKWTEVQKLGEGEMMGHLLGKGAISGAGKLYNRYNEYKATKALKTAKGIADDANYTGDLEDVPQLSGRIGPSNRANITDLDDAQDANPDALDIASLYTEATGQPASDIISSQEDLNLPGRQARTVTNLDDVAAETSAEDTATTAADTSTAATTAADTSTAATTTLGTTTTTTTTPALTTAATQENSLLSLTRDVVADNFDDTTAGGMNLTDVASAGRNLGTTIVRNIAPDVDATLDQAASLGTRMVGSINSAGSSLYQTLAERGSKGYLKAAGQKIGSFFKSTATDAADTTAEGAAEGGGELAAELTGGDAILGAIPILGEVALGISGVVALGEGIYHLFHKPDAPPPPKLVAPVQVPQNLTAKFASALPSSDNSLDRGASSVSF